jgi:hypothetical protein
MGDTDYVMKRFVVHRRGEEAYGSREYLLLPPGATSQDAQADASIKAAAILAHRNIIFGARAFHNHPLKKVCLPLVEAALKDSSVQGEQPQAIATLYGLCEWINNGIKKEVKADIGSKELAKLQATDPTGFEAVQAIASGVPRQGHSVVGVGTYRDGEAGWRALAKEFTALGLSEEVELYKSRGGQLVGVEHLADKNPEYLKSAGGAMARMFFL